MVVILEFHGFKFFVDDIHEILPDPARPGSTLKVPDALRRIAAYPDCSRIVVGKTAEPAVLGIVSRSGLACAGHPVIQSQSAACAPSFFHNALQYAHHLSGRVLVIDFGGSSLISIDRISLVVINPADT